MNAEFSQKTQGSTLLILWESILDNGVEQPGDKVTENNIKKGEKKPTD